MTKLKLTQAVVNAAVKAKVKLTTDETTRIAAEAGRKVKLFIDEDDGEEVEGIADEEGKYKPNDAARELIVWATDARATIEKMEHTGITRDAETRDFVFWKHSSEAARDPSLSDLLETITGEAAEDGDEDEGKGSVVPAKYKKRYAEQSPDRKVDCGDWLADQLAHFCIVPVTEGKKKTMTDLDRFEDIVTANGVDGKVMSSLRTERPGWQGRFRMTGRNLLVPLVATKGILIVPEGHNADETLELKAPKQWCTENAPKEKVAKAKAKADVKPAKGKGKAAKDAKPAKAKAPRKAKAKAAAPAGEPVPA